MFSSRQCVVFFICVHLALFIALSLSPGNYLVSSKCGHTKFPALTVSNSSLFVPALLRIYSFVFFAIHETRRIFLSPFISNASRRVFSFFLSVQLSQHCIATGHTSTFISRISLLKSVCCDVSIFSTVMSQSPTLCCCLPLHWFCQRWLVGCIYDGLQPGTGK